MKMADQETEVGQGKKVTQLNQLKRWTRVVADTGDFGTISEFEPEDATTNPSLIFKAAQMPAYKHLLERAIKDVPRSDQSPAGAVRAIVDELLVVFGTEILKIVRGRVSTETDASLSFDTPGLIAKARQFIQLYEKKGISRERILIKIATTWEGVRAAEVVQKEGINCNMTLLFSMPQAIACAEAGAKLISPFVGRILDWYKKKEGKDFAPAEDPGVLSVRQIYTYYKKFGYPTEVMGASFRNAGEIIELAGCDLLTISPNLLKELNEGSEPLERKLDPARAREATGLKKLHLDEKTFRWMLNEDAMATEKLAEGIRLFNADALKLEQYIMQVLK